MAELKDLLKYVPEAVGYFQGRRAIKDEIDRLREQDPVRQDRIQMDPALQRAFSEGSTRMDADQQETIDRSVQEAIRRNPRNIAKAIEAGEKASSKVRSADDIRRNRTMQLAGTLAQRLNQQNAAIDLGNELRERRQEDLIAGAEANKRRLNMRAASTLADLVGDATDLDFAPPARNLGTQKSEITDSNPASQEDILKMIQSGEIDLEGIQEIENEEEDFPLDFTLPYSSQKRQSDLEGYLQGDFQSMEGKGFVKGGAVVTPDGYDHDGVDINMTDAENGKFLGSVESAEMIVNAKDTNEGLRLAKKNPNNPLSKWYLQLTKRFQKEAKEREAKNNR
jgi:hypothetical protein